MAIAYLTGSNTGSEGSYVDTLSTNVTVSGVAPFVIAILNTDSLSGPGGKRTISTFTCGGEAMTLLGSLDYGDSGRMFVYYYPNPTAGTKAVAFTLNATAQCRLAVSVYTGVNASNPINVSGTSTNGTNTLTSTADNCWHVMGACFPSIGAGFASISAGSSTSLRNHVPGYGTGILDNNAAITPAGANSIIAEGSDALTVGAMLSPALIFNLTDTATTTETVSYIRRIVKSLTETISVIQLQTIALAETITMSDTYIRLKRAWQNLAKNISTWINEDKS